MHKLRVTHPGRGTCTATLLALALLAAPMTVAAQAPIPGGDSGAATGVEHAEMRLPAIGSNVGAIEASPFAPRYLGASLPAEAVAAPSLPRHLAVGAGVGAVVGVAFGLAMNSMVDSHLGCVSPNCTVQRVTLIVVPGLGGTMLGAGVGGLIYLIRK